jgi:hypothetical protein
VILGLVVVFMLATREVATVSPPGGRVSGGQQRNDGAVRDRVQRAVGASSIVMAEMGAALVGMPSPASLSLDKRIISLA